jgi:hypothetical protein
MDTEVPASTTEPDGINRDGPVFTGGCLCGAVRYEAKGRPNVMGHCYCADCRRASGGGFIAFMGFPAAAVRIEGRTTPHAARSIRGTEAVRNACPVCGSTVFGGVPEEDEELNIYAGSLDDPRLFTPRIAIFERDRAPWAPLPEGVEVFETMPGLGASD